MLVMFGGCSSCLGGYGGCCGCFLVEFGEWLKCTPVALLSFGQYIDIKEENFLQEVTTTEKCVVHFYHQDFQRYASHL